MQISGARICGITCGDDEMKKKDTGEQFHKGAIKRLKQKQRHFEADSPRWLELEREIRFHEGQIEKSNG